MKFHGIQIQEGSNVANLTVASGTSFPSTPNAGELFYRTDSDTRLKGLYVYVDAWERIASADAITAPSASTFPSVANVGDIFYKNSDDAFEGLYVYDGSSWIPAASGSGSSLTVTGDVTGTLTVGGSGALTLASVASAGVYGTASQTNFTQIDSKGRVIAITPTNINIAASQVGSGTFADARISQSSVTQHQAALTITEAQITDGSLLARNAGNETITGSWQFSNPVIVGTPTTGSQAATKQYVDSSIAGLAWKDKVKAATTGNITLSGTQTIDGYGLSVGDRVLVKNQSTASQNGIYVVAAGAWSRASDFDSTTPVNEVNSGTVFVENGSVNADTGWTQILTVTTIDSDSMQFVQFAGANTYIAGAGLSLSANAFNVGTASSSRIVINADDIDLATVTNSGSGTFQKLTVDNYGRVSGTTPVTTADITPLIDSTYVNVTGDTMTGDLSISKSAAPRLELNATADAVQGVLQYSYNGAARWVVGKDNTPETGSNVGSNFNIRRYSDAGTFVDNPFVISRSTGKVGIGMSPLGVRQLDVAGTINVVAGSGQAAALTISANGTTAGTSSFDFQVDGNGLAYVNQRANNALTFSTNSIERMRIDASGNVGVGVIPKNAGSSNVELPNNTSIGFQGAVSYLNTNTYYASAADRYASNGFATRYQSINGVQSWLVAASGTTGNAITFTQAMSLAPNSELFIDSGTGGGRLTFTPAASNNTISSTTTGFTAYSTFKTKASDYQWFTGASTQAMTLDGSGNLGIGTSSPSFQLDVQGTGGNPMALTRYANNSSSTSISLQHSRGTTVGSNVIVQSGDILGSILFNGANGTGFDVGAMIRAEVDGTPGASSDMPGRLTFFTSADGSSSPAERMRIDNAGNVGVGVIPAVTMHVRSTQSGASSHPNRVGLLVEGGDSGNVGGRIGIRASTAPIITFYASNGTLAAPTTVNANDTLAVLNANAFDGTSYAGGGTVPGFYMHAEQAWTSTNHASYLRFTTVPAGTLTETERMRIDASGNVGIGQPSTGARLQVATNAGAVGDAMSGSYANVPLYSKTGVSTDVLANRNVFVGQVYTNSNTNLAAVQLTLLSTNNVGGAGASIYMPGASGGALGFSTGGSSYANDSLVGTERMRIDSAGNVVIGQTTAAAKLHVESTTSASMLLKSTSTGTSDFADFNVVGNDVAGRFSAYGTNHSSRGGQVWVNANTSSVLVLSTNNTERVRVNAVGNVGISTGSALYDVARLQIGANSTGVTNEIYCAGQYNNFEGVFVGEFGTNGGGKIDFNTHLAANQCQSWRIAHETDAYGAGNLVFLFAGTQTSRAALSYTERARFDASGNFLIGKTGVGFTNVGFQYQLGGREIAVTTDSATSTANCFVGNRTASDGQVAGWFRNSSIVGSISITTSATTYNTTSDERRKENIVDAQSASEKIDAIKVRSFDWKEDGSHVDHGMIAQELVEVVPEAVHIGGDDEASDPWGVDHSKLVPMLIKEIQELRARVAALEAR